MRRVPLVPTLVVGLAVAAMVALGLWQLLDRLPAKQAYLASLAANPSRAPVAFPRRSRPDLLFRRAVLDCASPAAPARQGAGASGYRLLARCADGALVQLGTTRDFRAPVSWAGGRVTGYLSEAPDGRSLIGSLLDPAPRAMLLVAVPPLAGLSPNPHASVDSVPNNHLAYAGQWFFFAAVAAIIYGLALRRRGR